MGHQGPTRPPRAAVFAPACCGDLVRAVHRLFRAPAIVDTSMPSLFASYLQGRKSCVGALIAPCSSRGLLPNTCRRPSCWVSCQVAANISPGPARATSRLKPPPTARFGIRYMSTIPHHNKGQVVQLEGALVRSVLCKHVLCKQRVLQGGVRIMRDRQVESMDNLVHGIQ
ncbi:hypothetical protein HaLaN_08359 [Haematococcus lacustris]|uniref:Uncharacterized protein n=1 Tax=Haematococcus lacustris TaxID=44745 RepID=A0A699Z065_HAELA|nr:hypothetical protein HaLaN_08359 [Haematococcus lacustris]